MEPLTEGVYEAIRTPQIDRAIAGDPSWLPEFSPVAHAEAPTVLARHVSAAVARVLAAEGDSDRRLAVVNDLLALLEEDGSNVGTALSQLVSLRREGSLNPTAPVRPLTPLSDAALLTNARNEPSLSAELRAEIASADRIDLLCAFIKWHGLRVQASGVELVRDLDRGTKSTNEFIDCSSLG